MSVYTKNVIQLRTQYNEAQNLKKKIEEFYERLKDLNQQYAVFLEAQQLLATISDRNTTMVLDYITGIINKTLSEVFPNDTRRVYLEKKLFNGQHAHINLILTTSMGKIRDIETQGGTGLRQVVSFLFVVSLIEIRKGRRLLLMDEILNGLHPEAKRIVFDIISIFAEDGFQFAMVEYGVNNFGKIYLVEKPDANATITPLDGKYNDEVFIFNPPIDYDKNVSIDESEGVGDYGV